MYKVFINPGHSLNGNPDPGATGNGFTEASLVARIGAALDKKLKSFGFTTELYQQQGSGLTQGQQLNTVITKANASKADALVSIHMNSFDSKSKGTETIYRLGSDKGKNLAGLINAELTKPFSTITLANRGIKSNGEKGSGATYTGFNIGVLKQTNMPSVLTEIAFISNLEEAKFVDKNIDEIANRLCKGFCNYFGIVDKPKAIEQVKPVFPDVQLKLIDSSKDAYDLTINGIIKLKANKLKSCLTWINENLV